MIVEEKFSEIQAKNFLMIKYVMLNRLHEAKHSNSELISKKIKIPNGRRGDPDKVGERNLCNH